MNVETFKKLFVHRKDKYAIQLPNRSYVPVDQEITDNIIQAHLDGVSTIGLYQIIPGESTLKWAVVDVDISKSAYERPDFDIDAWIPKLQEQTKIIKEHLESLKIPSYIEFSGFKGYHLWMFFEEPIKSDAIYLGLYEIMKDIKRVDPELHWDLFPAQKYVSETGTGNLVKGPLSKHLYTSKYSKFIDDVTDLNKIKYCSYQKFLDARNPIDEIFKHCSAFDKIKQQALHTKRMTNTERIALGYVLINAQHKYSTADGEKYFINKILSKLNNYNEKTSLDNIENMKEAVGGVGYKPITCKKLQEQGLCPGPCKAVGKNKSPIVFYVRAIAGTSEVLEQVDDPFENFIMLGNSYYEINPGARGEDPLSKIVTNFIIDLKEEVVVSDGLQQHIHYNGTIVSDERTNDFSIKVEDYVNSEKFKRMIHATLGVDGVYIHPNLDKVRLCVGKFADTSIRHVTKEFGYRKNKEEDLYPSKFYSPSVIVDNLGVQENTDVEFDLTGEDVAANLDLKILSDNEFKESKTALDSLLTLSNFGYTHSAMAHNFLSVLFPFIDGEDTKYVYFVRGRSGDGKSYIMKFFQNFYGTFPNLASWTSTSTALHKIGYLFKDTIFVIDDFKLRNFGGAGSHYNSAITLMQNYADNTSRARSRADLTMQETYTIKGMLAATGEDTPSGEASTLARSIIVDCEPSIKDRVKGKEIEQKQYLFPGFTARYINHVLNINPIKINKVFQDYEINFYKLVKGRPNDSRISRNIALMMTSYKFISEFLWNGAKAKTNQDLFLKYLSEKVKEQVGESEDEMSSDRFIETIKSLLSAGKIRIQQDSKADLENNDRVPIIGWYTTNRSGDLDINLIPDITYSVIRKTMAETGSTLGHSLKAIMHDLYNKNLIYRKDTTARKLNGRSIRVITMKADVLDS